MKHNRRKKLNMQVDAAKKERGTDESSASEHEQYYEEDEDEGMTFNELEIQYNKMNKLGTKTVGASLGQGQIAEESSEYEDDKREGAKHQMEQHGLQSMMKSGSDISHLSLNVNYLAGMNAPGTSGRMFDWNQSILMH